MLERWGASPWAKRIFFSLPMAVRVPAVKIIKRLQNYSRLGQFYSHAKHLNVIELAVRGDYGVITQSVADRTVLPEYAATGRWNHQMNERLVAFFSKDGGTYVDVGANIGLTIIPVAQNPHVDAIGIEPDPSNFAYLSRNVAANCLHNNVTLHRVAAFNAAKTLRFELSTPANHRISVKDQPGATNEHRLKTIEVAANRLDEIIIVKRKPVAIKIDTEGAETFAIEGGSNLLSQADLFFTEVWPYGIAHLGGDIGRLVTLLKDHFQCFGVPADIGPEKIPAVAAAEFLLPLMERSNDPWFHFDLSASK